MERDRRLREVSGLRFQARGRLLQAGGLFVSELVSVRFRYGSLFEGDGVSPVILVLCAEGRWLKYQGLFLFMDRLTSPMYGAGG
jgi:hypothetical protein